MAATHEDRNANLSPGVAIKAPCRAATTGNITLSGEQTIDGVACVAGNRVLVKNQANPIDNGIWGVSSGAWSREPDFDGNRDVVKGTFVFITDGTVNAGAFYECTTTGTVVFGTSNITFAQGALGPIAIPISGSNVTFTQTGTATANSVSAKLQQIVSVKDAPFNAVGDGVTDDTAAIQAAITSLSSGGRVLFPRGIYLITTRLDVADSIGTYLIGDGYGSVIKKGANIDMVSLGLRGEMSGLRLDGAGATRTGRGIIVSTGGGGDGYQNIHDCWILDTASYCIEFTASGAGFGARVSNNRLDTYNRSTYAIKCPGTDSNGNRHFENNFAVGQLIDLAGSANCEVVGNTGGEDLAQTLPSITINSTAIKAVVVGNTFDCTNSISINGSYGTWEGNVFNAGYTLAAGATFNRIDNNSGTAAVTTFDTDNSASTTNELYGFAHTYTPTWTGSVVNPAIGNGTISGKYQRLGRRVSLDIQITMGSTTTFGTGTYTFGLPATIPAPGNGSSLGVARFFESGIIIRTGICIASAGGLTAEADSGTGSVGTTVPFAWANGDKLWLNILYDI